MSFASPEAREILNSMFSHALVGLFSRYHCTQLRTNKELMCRTNHAHLVAAAILIARSPERQIAMTLANLRFVERTSKTKTVDATMYQRTFGKGSILPFVKNESMGRGMAIEPEAELIAAADQIDVAEKTFHD